MTSIRGDDMRRAIPRAAMLLVLTVLLTAPTMARDDGRYANSPLKPWFESLHSEYGQCCSDADGYVVADVDWESDRGRYRVHLEANGSSCPKAPSSPSRTRSAAPWCGSTISTAIHACAASCRAA